MSFMKLLKEKKKELIKMELERLTFKKILTSRVDTYTILSKVIMM